MAATILVVEDDARAADLIRLMLRSTGHDIVIAENGLQGLKMVRESPPDLILLDLMLPGIDGFEVLHQIRSDALSANVPVAIVSAKTRTDDKQTASKLGVDEYLTKPFRKSELLALVEKLLPEDNDG